MAEISEQLEHFVAEIKMTDTYKEYEKQKERIKGYPDLKSKIDVYRQENYRFQNSTPSENLFDAMDAFQREYEDFKEIPMVHDFLEAELDYCRMIQEINEYLYEEFAVDFE